MPQKPITTFATAIAFGVLASAAIAAPGQQQEAETTARECHAAPKGAAPQGAHWYYRTNRTTNKKCWYLADEVAKPKKATRTAATRSGDSDDAAPQADSKADNKADTKAEKSIADARAEIPDDNKPTTSKPTTSEPAAENRDLADSVWPALPDKSETSTATAAPPAPASDDAGAFASRWPDQISTTAATDAQVMLARKQAEQKQQPQTQPQPAIAPTVGRAGAAMADEPAESPISTIGLLLSVLAGLLALAAIIGPAVFKRMSRRKPKAARRGIWDSVDHDNPPMPWDAEQPVRNDNTPSEVRDLDATNDELQKILQRASKRSAA